MSYVLTVAGTVIAMYGFHRLNVAAERVGFILGESPDPDELALIRGDGHA